MAKNESTAINSLISIVQGRIVDPPRLSQQWDDDAATRRVDPAVREAVLRQAKAYEAAKRAPVPRTVSAPMPIPAFTAAPTESGEYIAPPGTSPYHAPDTARVAAFPAATLTFREELGLIARRYTLQVSGVAVALAIAVGYLAIGGGATHSAEASVPAPAVAVIAAPVVQPAAPVEATHVAPVVTPIEIATEPTVAAPLPSLVDPSDVAAPEPAIEPESEIEMEPVVASRRHSQRAAKKTIAIAAPKREKRIAVADESDPVLAAIGKTAKAKELAAQKGAKGEGPAKLVITSSVPAMIYVDGRATNSMTPKTLSLAAGKHQITLLEPKSRKAKTSDIELTAGGSAKLDRSF